MQTSLHAYLKTVRKAFIDEVAKMVRANFGRRNTSKIQEELLVRFMPAAASTAGAGGAAPKEEGGGLDLLSLMAEPSAVANKRQQLTSSIKKIKEGLSELQAKGL